MRSFLFIATIACLFGILTACQSTLLPSFDPDGDADGDSPVFVECQVAADCEAGELCIDNECRLYCSDEVPCPDGQICDLITNSCIDDEPADGDDPDGDTPDGDTPDGDAPDGDTPDGDTPDGDATDGDATDGDATDGDATDGDATDGDATDGDVRTCVDTGCPPRQRCNTETGNCVYERNHCVVTGCPDGHTCNAETGECEGVYPNEWPSYCAPCFSPDDCASGSACLYIPDTQEAYCAPPCEADNACPFDAECVSTTGGNVCAPADDTCNGLHNIGGSCEVDLDCSPDAECLSSGDYGFNWPDGLCSKFCTAGDDSTCDNPYTRCTGIRPNEQTDYQYLCLHLCGTLAYPPFTNYGDCREGYACTQTSDGRRVCIPSTSD